MTVTVFEPTADERTAIDKLRTRCQTALRSDTVLQDRACAGLSLSPADMDRLLRREDWTLAAGLRIAQAIGLDVRLDLQVH